MDCQTHRRIAGRSPQGRVIHARSGGDRAGRDAGSRPDVRRAGRMSPIAPANPIIQWLCGTTASAVDYLLKLKAADDALGQSLGAVYALAEPRLRLATTLFFDYARAQALSAGEAAMLLADAERDTREALRFLFDRAKAEIHGIPAGGRKGASLKP